MEQGIYERELDSIGYLMTIEEWKEGVDSKFFTNYDGHGRAVKDNKMTIKNYYPTDAHLIPKDATHIMWYNK